ncbi:hypothetical protein FQA39_LY05563 [Lamprigera yunnana]|nr:hypothetical protein FQA39_LY05563 [Lamprigera yunnana]
MSAQAVTIYIPRVVKFSSRLSKVNELSAELSVTPKVQLQLDEEPRRAPGRSRRLRTEEDQVNEINCNSEEDVFVSVTEVTVKDALENETCDE